MILNTFLLLLNFKSRFNISRVKKLYKLHNRSETQAIKGICKHNPSCARFLMAECLRELLLEIKYHACHIHFTWPIQVI